MTEKEKVAVAPCAGMDKALGSVARASVFQVIHALSPEDVTLLCLPPLLAEVKPYIELVKTCPVVTVDGCAERCATKLVAKSGGRIRGRILVPQSVKKYGLKPKSEADIGSEGEELAERIAEEIISLVDKILGKE